MRWMVETASIWQQYCMNGRKREEKKEEKNAINTDLFQPAYTINAYKKKLTAVEDLVSGANEEDVRSFLTAVLAEEEKLYDRLLVYVLNSPGVYALQEYEKVLKKVYHLFTKDSISDKCD